ncbi:hypothetical protein K466DRAFT_591245 [Polyporus arcularius HHB13444]|uniref:Uncharacterized protein n=1 Tax=Polyporus arcularius HHB13444 TaxID=1314778 RepID=A0A5C3NYK3_9APHY|nr:hypothetical protein K466DRAFT_591245 [Polyporus arcularius HHB13444]
MFSSRSSRTSTASEVNSAQNWTALSAADVCSPRDAVQSADLNVYVPYSAVDRWVRYLKIHEGYVDNDRKTPAETSTMLTTAVSTLLCTSFTQAVLIIPRLVSTSFRVIPTLPIPHFWTTQVMVFLTAKCRFTRLQEQLRALLTSARDHAPRPVIILGREVLRVGVRRPGSTYMPVILIGLGRLYRQAQCEGELSRECPFTPPLDRGFQFSYARVGRSS